ncbi:kinase-like protein [Trametes sanguinea]|nr:kinase-like protein [Trametes sanguinea]
MVHPIPKDPLSAILAKTDCPLFTDISSQTGYTGWLSVNAETKAMLGNPGGFKTAHPATLRLDRQTCDALGAASIAATPEVAAKRCFFRKDGIAGPGRLELNRRSRYAQADEIPRMAVEANCLYWASALMEGVYAFIDEVLSQTSQKAAALHIPRLRFVYAALAIPVDDVKGPVYLLEERIKGTFVKYIPNNSLLPSLRLEKEEHEDIALFLCAAQHIQYLQTEGLAIVSDFQGDDTVLTDPQIMTTGDFATAFADGNLPRILAEFKISHQCNVYCQYFGLEEFQVSSDGTGGESEVNGTGGESEVNARGG